MGVDVHTQLTTSVKATALPKTSQHIPEEWQRIAYSPSIPHCHLTAGGRSKQRSNKHFPVCLALLWHLYKPAQEARRDSCSSFPWRDNHCYVLSWTFWSALGIGGKRMELKQSKYRAGFGALQIIFCPYPQELFLAFSSPTQLPLLITCIFFAPQGEVSALHTNCNVLGNWTITWHTKHWKPYLFTLLPGTE